MFDNRYILLFIFFIILFLFLPNIGWCMQLILQASQTSIMYSIHKHSIYFTILINVYHVFKNVYILPYIWTYFCFPFLTFVRSKIAKYVCLYVVGFFFAHISALLVAPSA